MDLNFDELENKTNIMEEIYIKIKGFENYEVSNFGNVKSLKNNKIKLLSQGTHSNGYKHVTLLSNGLRKTFKVHRLVCVLFSKNYDYDTNLVVNHIDFNKQNNRLDNLELVSCRENGNKKHLKSTSKYTGVYWHTKDKRWRASIFIDGKTVYLGNYKEEKEASNAYEKALKEIVEWN